MRQHMQPPRIQLPPSFGWHGTRAGGVARSHGDSSSANTHRATDWLRKLQAAGLRLSCNVVRRVRPADDGWNADAWPPDSGAAERVAGPPAGQAAARSRFPRDGDRGLYGQVRAWRPGRSGRTGLRVLVERIDADHVPGQVHAGKRLLLDALRRTGKVSALEALESRRDSGAEGYPRWMHDNSAAGKWAGMQRVVIESTKPRGRVKGRRAADAARRRGGKERTGGAAEAEERTAARVAAARDRASGGDSRDANAPRLQRRWPPNRGDRACPHRSGGASTERFGWHFRVWNGLSARRTCQRASCTGTRRSHS